MADIQVALDYLDQLRAKIDGGFDAPEFEDAFGVVLNNIVETLADYPPATEANQPGRYSLTTHKPLGYYERGRGWWYPVMRQSTLGKTGVGLGSQTSKQAARRGGVPGAFITVAGYKLAGGGKSEALGRHWSSQVITNANQIRGRLKNSASYGGYVQGDIQSALNRKRGWRTVLDVVAQRRADITRALQQAIKDFLMRTA